jgi:hypothetical protein
MNGLSCFQFPMRRASRFPRAEKRTASTGSGFSRWSPQSPLFIGCDGERITRGTLQSRIKRAFKRAGPEEQPVPGALVHGLCHTYATNTSANDRSASPGLSLMSAPAANAFSDPMITITPIKRVGVEFSCRRCHFGNHLTISIGCGSRRVFAHIPPFTNAAVMTVRPARVPRISSGWHTPSGKRR